MTIALTAKEADCLHYVRSYIEFAGIGPSFEEIMAAMSLKSKSGVHRLLVALEDRGHIHRLKGQARAIGLGPAPINHIKRCPHCFSSIDAVRQ